MKQKEIFLESEGDAWFARNQQVLAVRKLPDEDPVLMEILGLISKNSTQKLRILEVGCGDGSRLAWLKKNLNCECYGVDPSVQAVAAARFKEIQAEVGTAEALPFESHSFDMVIFGFCLYLCDREDLFSISKEADRVLRSPGWMVILDFYSRTPISKIYHHRPGIQSYKMDYSTLFTWHPDYECMTHKVRHHSNSAYTDLADEWTALSVLRKADGKSLS